MCKEMEDPNPSLQGGNFGGQLVCSRTAVLRDPLRPLKKVCRPIELDGCIGRLHAVLVALHVLLRGGRR